MNGLDAVSVERVAMELMSPVEAGTRWHSVCLASCTIDFTAAKALGTALLSGSLGGLVLNNVAIQTSSFSMLAAALEKNAALTLLHLRKPPLDSAAFFEPLARALEANQHLKELTLELCALEVAQIQTLVDGLAAASGLTALSLVHNPSIGAEGMRILAQHLAEHPSLRSLDASHANLGNAGAEFTSPITYAGTCSRVAHPAQQQHRRRGRTGHWRCPACECDAHAS